MISNVPMRRYYAHPRQSQKAQWHRRSGFSLPFMPCPKTAVWNIGRMIFTTNVCAFDGSPSADSVDLRLPLIRRTPATHAVFCKRANGKGWFLTKAYESHDAAREAIAAINPAWVSDVDYLIVECEPF